jgi:tRNA delta(2)-isopentenylpyrophosphate transferase
MKNIIIVGPSRSGKTSLAKRIKEEFNYYVISIDKLVSVFQNAYPQLDIRLNWDRDKTTENLAPFIGHFLGTFCFDNGNGQFSYSLGDVSDNKFIIEGAYYNFDLIKSILKTYGIDNPQEHFELIGLVQQQKRSGDFFDDFRKYDSPKDWTYHLSDEELKGVSDEAVSFSQTMYEQLISNNFNVYDTSVNREATFDDIIKELRIKANL